MADERLTLIKEIDRALALAGTDQPGPSWNVILKQARAQLSALPPETDHKSLWERTAHAIETSWHFSWHWPRRDWEPIALRQAEEVRDNMIVRLSKVQSVIKELEDVAGASGPR